MTEDAQGKVGPAIVGNSDDILNCIKSIFTKLNVLSRAEAIAAVARRGIVRL